MNVLRRTFLKSLGAGTALAALVVAGLMRPVQAFAAEWNKAAFDAKDLAGALKGLGAGGAIESKDLVIKAPDIAENGAVVPVDVVSRIPNTTQISVLVEKNPNPLAASFSFANGALPEMHVRLKFSETSTLKVVATADGKTYTAHKDIKVTVGGCGG